jgi:hypothetical protein
MRLLDVLEDYRGATIKDGGEEWSVADYIDEWEAGAEANDRGPEVICLPGEDGSLSLVALDERGSPIEAVSVLVP